MSNALPVHQAPHCPECGAEVQGFGDCWLCHRRNANLQGVQPPPIAYQSPAAPQNNSVYYTLKGLSIAAFLMVALIGLGLLNSDTSFGILFWIVVLPALVSMAVVACQFNPAQRAAPGAMNVIAKVVMAIGLTLGMIVVCVTVAVGALFIICTSMM
ncbi:hypothetical protein ETAA8_57250 [Anatilimnocola aggregata]|uniref:Uncharacterized protein n=1 Tax=Anatilimnocola aggregata TaxID=2528021 RepID=A0A517YK26_9BACT|nr:hypothetical protein [Anatilimnocola aggregata]QDU30579.1 hypothetical protein ETAA8_57250 [Anatilimnocola aggregata]